MKADACHGECNPTDLFPEYGMCENKCLFSICKAVQTKMDQYLGADQ